MNKLFNEPKFLMSLLETMAEGLMVVDMDGNILYMNPACEKITGYSKEEVRGKQCTILNTSTCVVSTNQGKQMRCPLFAEGCVNHRKCEIVKKDGSKVHLLKNAVVLKDDNGQVTGAVEVMTDVTSLYIKDLKIEGLKKELSHSYGFMGLIGSSPPMQKLYEQIENAAQSSAPIIICGESGTGKELIAEAIHKLSIRRKGPFIKVNCAALSESLLESELFGHVKGAFTGALNNRAGRFEAAHNGSIFLDEIGDMPLTMQVKLLRVLQEKEIERVGDHKPIKINVRLITATNRDLCELLELGKFREDLFYRINVIPIHPPPLRDRKEDIPLLLNHFLKRFALLDQKQIHSVSPAVMDALDAYSWPGNVRQLLNALEYAVMTVKDGVIKLADLPDYLTSDNKSPVETERKTLQGKTILEALNKHRWNRSLTARYLGISRVTLWKLMKTLKIDDNAMLGKFIET